MTRFRWAAALGALALAACNADTTTDPTTDLAPTDLAPDFHADRDGTRGFVVTMTNSAAGNEALVFPRDKNGALGSPTAFATGGNGTGAGLGNQGGITTDGRGHVFLVNAGSNTVSAFRIRSGGLELRQTVPSGGSTPISVTTHGRLLYVLNNGSPANITGFRIEWNGELHPIPGSTQPLSADDPAAAQVGFDAEGRRLIVTEKGTNNLVVYPVDRFGRAGSPNVTPSTGVTPFGFGFDRRNHLIVSEAFGGAPGASAVSSYGFRGLEARTISPSVATTQTAACWVLVAGNGRFAFVTNTGSASITGYAIDRWGRLTLLEPSGVSGTTEGGPIDLAATTAEGRDYVYSLNAGGHSISAFRLKGNGSLEAVGVTGGLPAGANGLIAF